jgi:hypothetical protein
MAKLSDFIDQSEIDEYLETSPDVLQAKLELADEVVDYARSISPEDSGEYKDGIKSRRYGRTGVGVVWTDDKSDLIEYGTEDTPEFAIRARTEEHFRSVANEAL